ncbi:ABC transporter permease [Anaerobium acetethylicum]|uniref:Putative aldouronate transport system permease protein n=1 Tax=Anaerobium acetethylicum TaxID=1619234 RepID=A0A1D3TV68_9FIRM|nr:ABC transporter permease subunit [Anaerobium acetethylicum]SCP98001.1 putative aldouronate transport system permease protein [Anaerobium acetethylicum]
MNKKSFVKQAKKYWPFYVMALPACVYFFINNYIPMGGLILAFEKYTVSGGIFGSKKVGLENFRFLFKSADAWIMTRNTLLYNLVFIAGGTILAIFVAYLLHELKSHISRKVFQTVILFPGLLSIIIVSYLANALLAGDTGYINMHILAPLGIEPISFYSEKKWWPFILIFVHFWQITGTNCILYLANMSAVDPGLYEAANLDGADRFNSFKNITLPCLVPTIITLTTLSVGKIFNSDFGLFYQVPMNSGAIVDVTQTIDTYVYRGLMNTANMGMSAAAGFYQSVVGFCLVMIANAIIRKISRENAMF